MGGVGLGGVASFLGIFWTNGALVGALFGAYGAKMGVSLLPPLAFRLCFFHFSRPPNLGSLTRKSWASFFANLRTHSKVDLSRLTKPLV